MVKRGHFYHILILAALGAYVFDTVREGVEYDEIEFEKKTNLRQRQLMQERMLIVSKSIWPECVNLRMSAGQCKEFIDNEIYNLFTDKDRYIRSLIVTKRTKTDPHYNAVSILMNDGDMVLGRDGNGMVYYDFAWNGSGEIATEEQQTAITPITAMEPTASLASLGVDEESVTILEPELDFTTSDALLDSTSGGGGGDPFTTDPGTTDSSPPDTTAVDTDDLLSYADDSIFSEVPIVVFESQVEGVKGATVGEYIESPAGTGNTTTVGNIATGADDRPIAPLAGGVLTDGTAESTPDGYSKIEDALAATTLTGEVTIEPAGERTIGPFDCAELTGLDCCLLIKLSIPDSDVNGNAIQCRLDYVADSTKKRFWSNQRGKKVKIFENHLGVVSQEPQISGEWPKGKEGAEFEEWLLKGGAPPLILQESLDSGRI